MRQQRWSTRLQPNHAHGPRWAAGDSAGPCGGRAGATCQQAGSRTAGPLKGAARWLSPGPESAQMKRKPEPIQLPSPSLGHDPGPSAPGIVAGELEAGSRLQLLAGSVIFFGKHLYSPE
jgi:hypothetical protein